MANGFNALSFSKKISVNIFDKSLIIVPITLKLGMWCVCIILNPSSIVRNIAIKNSSSSKSKRLAKYSIQLFEVSKSPEQNFRLKRTNNNIICNNLTNFVQHQWYRNKNNNKPIDEIALLPTKVNTPFKCKCIIYFLLCIITFF